MKVIFIGVHNKPGKTPLCSSTKSGKLIDKIIEKGNFSNCRKTNLFNTEYYPSNTDERVNLAFNWLSRIQPNEDDILVLLGANVHDAFPPTPNTVIKVAHPASKRSHKAMDEYVEQVADNIQYEMQPDLRCLHCGQKTKHLTYSGECSDCRPSH